MIIQVIVCVILIGSILFQSGKGEGLSSTISGEEHNCGLDKIEV